MDAGLPPLAFFVLVALLSDADGGSGSSFRCPLALVPVIWLALYGNRVQLLAVANVSGHELSETVTDTQLNTPRL